LCGSPQDLERALEIIEEEGPARGLHLNRHKSLHYIPPGDDLCLNPLPREIPITSSGFCLLGVPLGPDHFREAAVLGRVAKIQTECLREVGGPRITTNADYPPVSLILGYTPDTPLPLSSAISSLAKSALMSSWCSLEDIEAGRHLFQRLSICLWRGNATLWAHRLPPRSAWVDGNI
jgi:hypothetical protein